MAPGKETNKGSNDASEKPEHRPWKSAEAAEAAAGLRPGSPSYWEQWAELPPSVGGSEIDHAIFGGLGFTPTRHEDEKYEDGARRFLQCARAANELAFEIRGERVRKRDEAVVAEVTKGNLRSSPTDAAERARMRFLKLMRVCGRWGGSWFPVFELMKGMEDFSGEEYRRPIIIKNDDDAQIARLALNLHRISNVMRILAGRSQRPTKKGRPLDVERMKLIHFARRKGFSLRQLAQRIVEVGFNATRSRRPSRTTLKMTATTDDDGRILSAKGKAVPNPALCDEDGKPIPEEEFQRLSDDWKEEQVAAWEDRLRSAEASQVRPRKRTRRRTGTPRGKETP